MAEHIEKDSLIKEGWHLSRTKSGDGFINIEQREIKDIPAADVREVAHGEWIRCGDGENVPYMCSHCGKTSPANLIEKWGADYCTNCGADMREVTDEKKDFNP